MKTPGHFSAAINIIGLESPSQPLQDAIAAVGGDAIETVFPVLCAPLWALTAQEYNPIAGKLPLLP